MIVITSIKVCSSDVGTTIVYAIIIKNYMNECHVLMIYYRVINYYNIN